MAIRKEQINPESYVNGFVTSESKNVKTDEFLSEKEKKRLLQKLNEQRNLFSVLFAKNKKCDEVEREVLERLQRLRNSPVSSVRSDADGVFEKFYGKVESAREKAKRRESKYLQRKSSLGYAADSAIRSLVSGDFSLQSFAQDFHVASRVLLELILLAPQLGKYQKAVNERKRLLEKLLAHVEDLEKRQEKYFALKEFEAKREVVYEDSEVKKSLKSFLEKAGKVKSEEKREGEQEQTRERIREKTKEQTKMAKAREESKKRKKFRKLKPSANDTEIKRKLREFIKKTLDKNREIRKAVREALKRKARVSSNKI